MAYCETCNRYFSKYGIARHRAMHRDKKERCIIELQSGRHLYYYDMSDKVFETLIKRPWISNARGK